MSNDPIWGAPENGATTAAENRITKALHNALYKKNAMGSSKHFAKQESRRNYLLEYGSLKGWNPSKLEGIYSRKTLETYLDKVAGFSKFCAEHGAKRLSDLTEATGGDYLRALAESGASDWTIATTAGHDTDLLGAVSGALGHNRIEVVLGHYLYLY